MDTPGFSSLYIDDLRERRFEILFSRISALMKECADLTAAAISMNLAAAVAEAVESGRIHRIRYRDYVDMYHELEERKRY